MSEKQFREYPSGRVLCCLRVDGGAIICMSDSGEGEYDKRAQEASQKVDEAYLRYQQPIGKMIDTVV